MANGPTSSNDQTRLKDVLAEDHTNIDDCLPCRLIGINLLKPSQKSSYITLRKSLLDCSYKLGASAFLGLGVYSYVSGQSQLQKRKATIDRNSSIFKLRARQTGITGVATVLMGMGVWRLIN